MNTDHGIQVGSEIWEYNISYYAYLIMCAVKKTALTISRTGMDCTVYNV